MSKLSPEVFIDRYKGMAIANAVRYGVPASITVAQAALESGWGGSELTTTANNFFGIKSYGWDGATINRGTHEYYGSGRTDIKADFRAYGSPEESFIDHSKFLMENSRYDSLFTLPVNDYRAWSIGLKSAGYATSPTYATKLINLIEKYDLDKLDKKPVVQKTVYNLAIVAFPLFFILAVLFVLKILK